jgi:hypothetical protein
MLSGSAVWRLGYGTMRGTKWKEQLHPAMNSRCFALLGRISIMV